MMLTEQGKDLAMGCFYFAMLPISIVVKAFVLCQMWAWFMVPLGVMLITPAHTIGIVVSLWCFLPKTRPPKKLKKDDDDDDDDDEDEPAGKYIGKAIGEYIFTPLATLLIGYVCHRIMTA